MLRKILATFVVLAGASSAQAAFIQCDPGQADVVLSGVATSTTFNCNVGAGLPNASGNDDNLAGDGWNVTAIRMRVSGTFQDNDATTGTRYSVLYTTANGNGFGTPSCTATALGDRDGQALDGCVNTSSFLSLLPTDFIPAFTVMVTGAATGGDALPFNASASVFYEVRAEQVPVVPEPGSMALVGLALAGLGLTARRRAAK